MDITVLRNETTGLYTVVHEDGCYECVAEDELVELIKELEKEKE